MVALDCCSSSPSNMDTGKCILIKDNEFVVLWAGKDEPEVQRLAGLHNKACCALLDELGAQNKEQTMLDLASFLVHQQQEKFTQLACSIVSYLQNEKDESGSRQLVSKTKYNVNIQNVDKLMTMFTMLCALVGPTKSPGLQQEYRTVLKALKETSQQHSKM